MTTKILDIQEFNTTMGILRIETRISEVSDFRSVIENKVIFNDKEYPNVDKLKEELGPYDTGLLRDEVYSLTTVLELCKQAYSRAL